MAQKILTIHSTVRNVVQKIDVLLDPAQGKFITGLGKHPAVSRVDFFDGAGKTVAIFPCEQPTSIVEVDSVFTHLTLKFDYLIGAPHDTSGFESQIEFFGTAPFNDALRWRFAGIDGNTLASDGDLYLPLFDKFTKPDFEIQNDLNPTPIPSLPGPWQYFNFGGELFYRVRNFVVGNSTYPVFTLERGIPAFDGFGSRLLPPPFAVPIALRENGIDPKKVSLRAVQRPADNWVLNTNATATSWIFDISGFQPGSVTHFWQRAVVDRHIGALQAVRDASPVSLLPSFASLNDPNWRLLIPTPESDGPASLQFLGKLDVNRPDANAVSLTCNGFQLHSGEQLALTATLANLSQDKGKTSPYLAINLTGLAVTNAEHAVRIGSLDITFPPNAGADSSMSCVVHFNPALGDYWLPRLQLNGSSALSDLQPGGQDDPADPNYAIALAAATATADAPSASAASIIQNFQREQPLLIPVPQTTHAQSGLSLRFHETSSANADQQLNLTVFSASADAGDNEVLIIDRNPFTIALTRVPNLGSTASAETSQVAQWSNSFPEGPGWRISAGAGTVHLLLPPQGIGEAMVTGNLGETDGSLPVDFRFTPPAEAVLQTSSQIQRYAEPGWNLRRVLGYPGERAPGAAVETMRFEMLYGLTCNIATGGLKMSEMFSRLGGFAGPLVEIASGSTELPVGKGTPYTTAEHSYFETLNASWGALYSQLLSRLGIFELWNQEREFDLLLTDGVSYDLRETADPIKGGVLYALELDELLDEIRVPHSSAAALVNPRFSALGGYGRQRASFNNDIITVEADVSMGRLESLTVTVIGRIANLWHRAKHVTIYERSVRPSRQFYLEQPLLEGRPLLRKTSEYVEILQKARVYPESGPVLGSGFLQGAEFKSIRINVDSRWRSHLADKGWTIPLWRRDAEPKDVYPKPHVTVQLATDPATGNAFQHAEILDPEKLHFYTDPTQKTANTDQWPAIQFVDYSISQPLRSINDLLGVRPDYSTEPGFGRFTYSVGSDAGHVDVVSQRAANSMASALRNVTFMRAQPRVPEPTGTVQTIQMNAGQVHDHVANALDELRKKASAAGATIDTIVNRLTDQDIAKYVTEPYLSACSNLQGADESVLCQQLANAAAKVFVDASRPISLRWNKLIASAKKQLTDAVGGAQHYKDSIQHTLVSELAAAFIELQTLIGPVLADLSVAGTIVGQLTKLISTISNDLDGLKNRINNAANNDDWTNCHVFAQRCFDDINATLNDIQLLLDSTASLFGGRAQDIAATAAQDLTAFKGAITGSFNSLLQAISTQVVNTALAAVDTTKTILTSSQLATDLPVLATKLQAAGSSANQIAASLRGLRDNLRTAILGVGTTVDNDFVKAITSAFDAFGPPNFDQLFNSTADAIRQQVSNGCKTILTSLNSIVGDLKNLLDPAAVKANLLKFSGGGTDFLKAIDDLQTQYISQLDNVVRRVRDLATGNDVATASDATLTLLRAFGAPPKVPGLTYALPSGAADAIAYFYTSAQQAGQDLVYQIVKEVPVSSALTSAVDQASSVVNGALKQLNIAGLPTSAVLDRLVPDVTELLKMKLSSLLPNIAGLNLGSLFPAINVPALASENIRISHQVDPQHLRASLDVSINFPIEGYAEVTLFSLGPATVTVENCVFHADVHVAAGTGQAVTTTSSGSISADWHVYLAGTEIITFERTALTFDQGGHLNFDIQPARVHLAAALQFVTDLVDSLQLGGGFSLNVTPNGIQCILDLPLPDLTGGAFGLTNVSLGCLFELQVIPEFAIVVGANLSKQKAPFTLTIFILGGAGWFDANITYKPGSGQFTADVSLALLASASLSISLGPIKGGVYIYFGITVEYHSAGGLNIGILIMIQGRVSLLGILDIDITLLLEAQYTSGGGLIGRGEVDISIKICWCFTLEVHRSVEFTFGSASHSASPSLAPHHAALPLNGAGILAAQGEHVKSYALASFNRVNFLS